MKYILTFFLVILALPQMTLKAQGNCITGCNEKTYVNSINPNTIEYDNMVSVYASSMVKESNGKIKVWGQGIAFNGTGTLGNVLVPQEINATNYPGLTGSILKFAAGSADDESQQFAVLTTTGLFIWGGPTGTLVSSMVKPSNVFGPVAVGTKGVAGTKADGLPTGVAPPDVKMMFGTQNTLAIVTCTGEAWMLTSLPNIYGDGSGHSASNSAVWHRVKTDATTNLTKVVALRGSKEAMMALTSDGNIYTWGSRTFLGSIFPTYGIEDRAFATLMLKPAGITPKMIGMTRSNLGITYYLLATNGSLYSLGYNDQKQLGQVFTSDLPGFSWGRAVKSTTLFDFFTDIAWISPQEHDGGDNPAINVLTTDGKLWGWGKGRIITGGNSAYNPTYMPGSITADPLNPVDPNYLNKTDLLSAVETGGVFTLLMKRCNTKLGYVGEKNRGSMGDNTSNYSKLVYYNFSSTPSLSICGNDGPAVTNLKICAGTLANLNDAEPASLPPGATGIKWFTTITRNPGTEVINKTAVAPGTYYAFYEPLIVTCPSMVTVSYYLPTDPQFAACTESDLQVTKSVDKTSATVFDNVVFTIVATNNGPRDNTGVSVSDLLPNGFQYDSHTAAAGTTYVLATGVWTIGNLNNGQSRTLKIYGKVKTTGNYTNTAVINTTSGLTDPNIANNTADATVAVVCVKQVLGENFSVANGVTKTFTQPPTNFGFVFDIYTLDNSFNMNINGTSLATAELQFQSAGTLAPGINVRFVDGTLYETNTQKIKEMTGTNANPLIRVVISPTGALSLFGSKFSGGPLFPLELFNGATFNTFNWNAAANNVVTINQVVTGVTYITGRGYGLTTVPCACYDDPTTTGTTVPTRHGFTLLERTGADNGSWPMIRNGAHTALESNNKGFVITRMTTAQITAIVSPQEGMMVYDTDDKCLKINTTGTSIGWSCFNTPACSN